MHFDHTWFFVQNTIFKNWKYKYWLFYQGAGHVKVSSLKVRKENRLTSDLVIWITWKRIQSQQFQRQKKSVLKSKELVHTHTHTHKSGTVIAKQHVWSKISKSSVRWACKYQESKTIWQLIKMHTQKEMVLGNLKEIYKPLKSRYLAENLGFSKFPKLHS